MARRTYGLKCLRNFLLAAAVALLLWIAEGYPLPPEMDLHRTERQQLLERSEVVMTIEGVRSRDYDLLVGVADHYIHSFAARKGSGKMNVWDRNPNGPTLVTLAEGISYAEGHSVRYHPAFAAVDPPLRAVSARLEVVFDYKGIVNDTPLQHRDTYVMEGEWQDSVLLFRLLPHQDIGVSPVEVVERNWLDGLSSWRSTQWELPPYTLTFYDGGGNVIETLTGGEPVA